MTKPAVTSLSWGDRFALIDHYAPTTDQILVTFNLTPDEYEAAQMMRSGGMFGSSCLDPGAVGNVFSKNEAIEGASTYVPPTERPTPKKRGRKGTKIVSALAAVPLIRMPIDEFVAQTGVSVAVLRQSKRFMETMDPETARAIGTIFVRQDKSSGKLMIWRSSEVK